MENRRACTSGGMVVVTETGARRNVPSGVCWIGPRVAGRDVRVSWTERGTQLSAAMTDAQLRSYLNGCMLQYS